MLCYMRWIARCFCKTDHSPQTHLIQCLLHAARFSADQLKRDFNALNKEIANLRKVRAAAGSSAHGGLAASTDHPGG
jgi:hypothetical protein